MNSKITPDQIEVTQAMMDAASLASNSEYFKMNPPRAIIAAVLCEIANNPPGINTAFHFLLRRAFMTPKPLTGAPRKLCAIT